MNNLFERVLAIALRLVQVAPFAFGGVWLYLKHQITGEMRNPVCAGGTVRFTAFGEPASVCTGTATAYHVAGLLFFGSVLLVVVVHPVTRRRKVRQAETQR